MGFFLQFGRNLAEKWKIWPKFGQKMENLAEKWKIWPKFKKFGRNLGNFIHFGRNSFIQNGNHSF